MRLTRKIALGLIVVSGCLWFINGPAVLGQNVLPSFSNVPLKGSPYINPSIGGASTFTGFTTITANCPNGSVNLGLDGVVVQAIKVENNLDGGANLQLTQVQVHNLASAPNTTLDAAIVFGVTASGTTYCIAISASRT